jgi:pyridoxine 4-dehydrogenase
MSEKTYELAGKTVGRVGFGAMQLGDVGEREGPSAEVAGAVLREAVGAGANHLDTAEFYGGGEVNRRIRAALAPYPDDLLIATKVGAVEPPDGGLAPAQKPAELREQVEANLRSLGVEALDLVYIRRVDSAPGIVAEGDQVVDLDDQLAELAALREEGKVRAIGLSHVSREQVERALPAGIVAVQNWYGLLNREDEPTLELCAANDIAWVPFFPLGSAFGDSPDPRFAELRHVRDVPEVQEIAAELGATPAQVGLAWLPAHAPNALLIPGTSSPEHLRENLAAGDLALPAVAMSRLDAIT